MSKNKKKVVIQPKTKVARLNPIAKTVMTIDRSEDQQLLRNCPYNWATLALSEGRASEIISNYMLQVASLINSEEYFETVPVTERKAYTRACHEFTQLTEALQASIDLARDIRKDRTNAFESLEEYKQYTSACTEIAGRINEFITLSGPLIAAILSYGVPAEGVAINEDVVTTH